MKSVNSDVAYDYIRKRILNGEYAAGESLATNTLSEVIGVSRTPVRDALRQLEADGLVTIQPRLGASVTAMDLKEFSEMCGLRLALETHAAGLAATNRTEGELQEVRLALEGMRTLTEKIVKAAREEPLLSELRKEDVRFHVAIMSAAKNDLMKKEILRLHLISRVVATPAPAGADPVLERTERDKHRLDVLKEHEAIFEAIRRSDAPTAKLAMERHIQGIVDTTLRAMARAERGVLARELSEEELNYTA